MEFSAREKGVRSRPLVAHRAVWLGCDSTSAIGARADYDGATASAEHDVIDPNVWSGRALQEVLSR